MACCSVVKGYKNSLPVPPPVPPPPVPPPVPLPVDIEAQGTLPWTSRPKAHSDAKSITCSRSSPCPSVALLRHSHRRCCHPAVRNRGDREHKGEGQGKSNS